MKISYEPHPVTPERKAELRKQGFRIIDARFKPDHIKADAPEEPAQVPTVDDIDGMKKAEAKEWLEAHGAETEGTVAELRGRLRSVLFVGAE